MIYPQIPDQTIIEQQQAVARAAAASRVAHQAGGGPGLSRQLSGTVGRFLVRTGEQLQGLQTARPGHVHSA